MKNIRLKKTILNYSFLFLALMIFGACEKDTVEDQLAIEDVQIYGSDKNNSGSIGSSGGDDEDDDYN